MINNIDKNYDVVILTYKPSDILIDSLKMLLMQHLIPNNIIIYNTDKDLFLKNITNAELLLNLINDKNNNISVYHIDKKEFDHGRTRNIAFSKTSSKYVLFMTDDAVPYDDMLAENLIDGFYEYNDNLSKVAMTYARQIAKDNAKFTEKLIREYNYPDYDIIKDKSKEKILGIKNYFCSNVCAMYDRDIFMKCGMFHENLILNEDTFFIYDAINSGYKVIYKSNAKIYHSHNYTYKEQFSRNFDIGVSQKEKEEIFKNISSEKEGIKLIKFVTLNLLKKCKFISIIDFYIECCYRYFGFKAGKNFDKLSNDLCIKYANNKNYFIKK